MRELRELGVGDEPGVAGVGARGELAADRAREVVEDHEVIVVGDLLDDACERADLDDEPGLLADLARHGLGQRLGAFELAAGDGPQAFAGRPAAADHQHAAVGIKDERTNGDDGGHRDVRRFAAGFPGFPGFPGFARFAVATTGFALARGGDWGRACLAMPALGHSGASTQWIGSPASGDTRAGRARSSGARTRSTGRAG